jgi:hypothetical protein
MLSTEPLLASNVPWDLLITLPNSDDLPPNLQKLVSRSWTVRAGIPSALIANFSTKSKRLLDPETAPVASSLTSLENLSTSDSSKNLELSPDLLQFAKEFYSRDDCVSRGPVSMYNLLSFVPGKREQYKKYGAEFSKTVGSKRGGVPKLVGTVVGVSTTPKGGHEWDEIALVHYPSILHFVDMISSKDYQEVNRRYRLGSLRDTFILCTSEIGLPWEEAAHGAKL